MASLVVPEATELLARADVPPLRVGLDARVLGSRSGGLETYMRNLIRVLPMIDPDTRYTLFLDPSQRDEQIPGAAGMRRVVIDSSMVLRHVPRRLRGSSLWSFIVPSLLTSLAMAREHIDVMHVQQAAPALFSSPLVVTLHDIVYDHFPELFPSQYVRALRLMVPVTLRRSAMIVTDAEFSKRDIVRRYQVSPDKIRVAPCAADPQFKPIHDQKMLSDARRRYETGDRFILCVGRLEPHKNIESLVAAYALLRRRNPVQHKLVIVGQAADRTSEVFGAARASGYGDDLVFTGYVPEEDLVLLYNAAEVFVYPSLFEGFGLPPLEAMACGTAVVTSNSSSLPEVVGEAGLLVDPHDIEGLAEAIRRVVEDEGLRRRLEGLGLEQSRMFSWERTARITLETYRRAARGRAARDRSARGRVAQV